jgi:beta-hydroxylase
VFFDAKTFLFSTKFESHWEDIKREYNGLGRKILDGHRNLPPESYVAKIKSNNGWMPSWQAGSDQPNRDWLTYGLCYRGIFPDEAWDKFPVTAKLLQEMGGSLIVGAFSLMRGPSYLLPHRHANLGGHLLTYHFGIEAEPGRSYLNVSGSFAEERERNSIVFDGSYDHFAFNMSKKERVIIYIEFDKSKLI